MATKRDFQGLRAHLAPHLENIVKELLPEGRLIGNKWVCSGVDGTEGNSADFDFDRQLWRDWAEDEHATDVTGLYAKVHSITPAKAYDALAKEYAFKGDSPPPKAKLENKAPPAVPVPSEYGLPDLDGTKTWVYRDAEGRILFYVERVDKGDGKIFVPHRWDGERKRWIAKAWPAPRPLYQLDLLTRHSDRGVVVFEGEKTAAAAQALEPPKQAITTWSNGSNAHKNTDWTPLAGRRVLLVPDNDAPGLKAMREIGERLQGLGCIVSIAHCWDQEAGWDIADRQWRSWSELAQFLKPYVKPLQPAPMADFAQGSPTAAESRKPALRVVDGGRTEGNAAIADEPEVAPKAEVWAQLGLELNTKGQPYMNESNAYRIIAGIPELADNLWFDTFYEETFTSWGTSPRQIDDQDYINLLMFIQSTLGLSAMRLGAVEHAVTSWCRRHPRDEPMDWLRSLEWDGQPRIDTFLHRTLGVEESEYTTAVSRNMWLSIAARITHPGCQCDYMVIFEGDQGLGKSTAWKLIGSPMQSGGKGPSWMVDTKYKVGSTDFYMAMQGVVILNMDELDSLNGVAQTMLKSSSTCSVDKFRSKYDRRPKSRPRRCIWVGTTNSAEYLLDTTGGRRYWPVKIAKVERAMIVAEREQCYAEAFARIDAGEQWWQIDEGLAKDEQENRREADIWEEPIATWLAEKVKKGEAEIHPLEIATGAVGLDTEKISVRDQRRIGRCLKVLGWESKPLWRDGRKVRLWVPPDAGYRRGNPNLQGKLKIPEF